MNDCSSTELTPDEVILLAKFLVERGHRDVAARVLYEVAGRAVLATALTGPCEDGA